MEINNPPSTGSGGTLPTTFNDGSNSLFLAQTATTPAANLLTPITVDRAELMLGIIDPEGDTTPLAPHWAFKNVGYCASYGNTTSAPNLTTGSYRTLTALGTVTARTYNTGSLYNQSRRSGYVSAAAAGSLSGLYGVTGMLAISEGSGRGGFLKMTRFAISDAAVVAGARMFVGISSVTVAPTNVAPSTLTASIGVGHSNGDTTLKFYYGGTSAQTPIDLGANFPVNTTNTDVYELVMYSSPTIANKLFYRVTRLNTGDVASGTIDDTASPGTKIPAATTRLVHLRMWRTNNATASAVGLDFLSDYFDSNI
jgi:hypothetical protein